MAVIIGIDDIDRILIVVLVAFLAILDGDVPAQVIVKDAGSQAEHLFEQMLVLVGIMRFDNDDHDENHPLVARPGIDLPIGGKLAAAGLQIHCLNESKFKGAPAWSIAGRVMVRSASRSSFLFEHDLFGKPVSTFPDHAL
jgi:hypothetical protein